MNATQEQWRPVVGYEGQYEVSDWGRVRSLPRAVRTARGYRKVPGRVLKGTLDRGYVRIGLWRDGAIRSTLIHAVVMEAFVGPRPADMDTRHIDGNGINNTLCNLAYGTRQENIRDEVRHGTHIYASRLACIRGHEYTPETSFWRTRRGSTERVCRICEEIREARRNRRRT